MGTTYEYEINYDKWIVGSLRSVQSWKSEFTKQLLIIDSATDALSEMCGQRTTSVLISEETHNHRYKDLTKEGLDHNDSVKYYLTSCQCAVHSICVLMKMGTELEKPIPALIVLRVLGRLCEIRPQDYVRANFSEERRLIYSNSTYFAHLYLHVLENLTEIGKTNMLRWYSHFIGDLIEILRWTSKCGLYILDSTRVQYFDLRSHLYDVFMKTMSLFNAQLMPDDMLEELIQNFIMPDISLSPTFVKPTVSSGDKNFSKNQKRQQVYLTIEQEGKARLACKALECMTYVIQYSDAVTAGTSNHYRNNSSTTNDKTQKKKSNDRSGVLEVRKFVVNICLDLYRTSKGVGESSTKSKLPHPYDRANVRYQLLSLFTALLNVHPVLNSMTELSINIFERALRVETDVGNRRLCQTALNVSTRRPILLSTLEYSIDSKCSVPGTMLNATLSQRNDAQQNFDNESDKKADCEDVCMQEISEKGEKEEKSDIESVQNADSCIHVDIQAISERCEKFQKDDEHDGNAECRDVPMKEISEKHEENEKNSTKNEQNVNVTNENSLQNNIHNASDDDDEVYCALATDSSLVMVEGEELKKKEFLDDENKDHVSVIETDPGDNDSDSDVECIMKNFVDKAASLGDENKIC